MYRIDLHHGGFMIARKAQVSKSGNSLVLTFGECDCYKNSCNCATELALPMHLVAACVPPAAPAERVTATPGDTVQKKCYSPQCRGKKSTWNVIEPTVKQCSRCQMTRPVDDNDVYWINRNKAVAIQAP